MNEISIIGAKTHNLANLNLKLPRDSLIVITGPSGSGKSSLAFDTLYAEGQRRYVESLSAYARQFLSVMEKPDVEHIDGLSPAISIEQKTTSHNPRSTVGTVTEIYDYLRLLYARVGIPYCPTHKLPLSAQTVSQMVDAILALAPGTKIMILAPVVRQRKGEFQKLLSEFKTQGFIRARIDGQLIELDNELPKLSLNKNHNIEIVVDRIKVSADKKNRLADSLETALKLAQGLAEVVSFGDENSAPQSLLFSANYACIHCSYSLKELEPRLFSFNNPAGACPSCDGLGVREFFEADLLVEPKLSLQNGAIYGWDRPGGYYLQLLEAVAKHYNFSMTVPFEKLSKKAQEIIFHGSKDEEIKFSFRNEHGKATIKYQTFEGVLPNYERRYLETESAAVREELAKFLVKQTCSECNGERLALNARNVLIENYSLPMVTNLTIEEAIKFFAELKLSGMRQEIAAKILKEISARLSFLNNVGLAYLSLNRSTDTLSGGEAQRIRLASQIGAGLTGVMYVLDEPTIGLHQRDNARLIQMLLDLRNLGNTVIVVEHDEDMIRAADWIVDMGPGAGIHGGKIVAQGELKNILATAESLTGQYLSGQQTIQAPAGTKLPEKNKFLKLVGASGNNLKNITVEFPLGFFICVTGVSGSGKSTLINDTLYPALWNEIYGGRALSTAAYQKISGIEACDKVINIDQSPIGRTPRSNPATYTGIFTPIRELFAATPEARARGYQPGRFSFNVKGGRCEACQGDGELTVSMHFLPDVHVSCDVCQGKRYGRETLEITYKGKNIFEVLQMTVEEAYQFFSPVPVIAHKLKTLLEVGLGYIQLGQNATTLSGGEAQRVKLAKELTKRDTGSTIYILDEPTTGLHFKDIAMLLKVLFDLRERGNTIIVIEHNLDIIKNADWIIDLGPEGGHNGGYVIATGTPQQVANTPGSHTGAFLAKLLNNPQAT